jgi:glucosyl-dolichyl phosphate glucuronosyltransferase
MTEQSALAAPEPAAPAFAVLTGSARAATADEGGLPVTVVICAYTERRWDQIVAALSSSLDQLPAPRQVLLVVDHNPDLAARARREFTGVTIVENGDVKGLSGARNTGLRAATEPVTVFLDDDAQARPGWLADLTKPYDDPAVVATGGSVIPWWPGPRPRWMPRTFDWVVGCSYLGMPETTGPIRNPIGANMSMRTELALEVGGFDVSVGRVGRKPSGCEETEMSIRLTAHRPGASVLYVPAAAVDHHVAAERINMRYFLSRCWHEGISKATVVELAGSGPGLERERRHAAATIPAALLRDLGGVVKGDLAALPRTIVALSGLASAVGGYLTGRAHMARSRRPQVKAELA